MIAPAQKALLTKKIYDEAIRLGFADCGFAEARELKENDAVLTYWLQNKYQANMAYMEQHKEKRLNPAILVEGAKTVISLLYNYFPSTNLTGSPLKIAKYAYGKDYHYVLKAKLAELAQFIKENYGTELNQRYFVDTAPVLERAWAHLSGLGWIGKNSCLISPSHGSFCFISEIITTIELEYNTPIKDYCGTCTKCIDACPTKAILPNRSINSNRCISYHTIENRGEIPTGLANKFNNFIYGCDICQDVCPWNKKSNPHNEPLFHLKPELKNMTLNDWKTISEKTYQEIFSKSAIKRAKYSGLKRNIEKVTNCLDPVNQNNN